MISKILSGIYSSLTFLLLSCSNIDCPLENVVLMSVGLYDNEGNSLSVSDTLTVTSFPSDSILLNKGIEVTGFAIPLRHGVEIDTLLLKFSEKQTLAVETLFVYKTDIPHFESIDCPASLFHNLIAVKSSASASFGNPLLVDSIAVVRSKVDYNNVENIKIYFNSIHQ